MKMKEDNNVDIEQLTHAANELNASRDRLTALMSHVEEELRPLNIGVEAWVEYGQQGEAIGHAKSAQGWGICIRRPNKDVVAFKEASVAERFRGVEHIHLLLPVLCARVESQAEAAIAAEETLSSFVDALREVKR